MPREYASRARGLARALSVLDLRGRIAAMLKEATRRGCNGHVKLLAKFQADLAAATDVNLAREDSLQLFDSLVETAELIIETFAVLEKDAASICCSIEAEGIIEASDRARAAYAGGRRNRTAGRWKWRAAVPCEVRCADEIAMRVDDVAQPTRLKSGWTIRRRPTSGEGAEQ